MHAFNIPIKKGTPPFFIFGSAVSFAVSVAWVITLYLGCYMSEIILRRFVFFNKKLFPTLLFSALASVFISPFSTLGIATIDIHAWQQGFKFYNFLDTPILNIFLAGEYNYFIRNYWVFFNNYLLISLGVFFLIECSKYRDVNWKSLFFLMAFIYLWINRFFPIKSLNTVLIVNSAIFTLFFLLAVFSPLPFEYGWIDYNRNIHSRNTTSNKQILDKIPLFIIFILIFIGSFNAFIIRNQPLIISIIPVGLLILLSVSKIPFILVFILTLLPIIFWGPESILMTMPVIMFSLFQILERMIKSNASVKMR